MAYSYVTIRLCTQKVQFGRRRNNWYAVQLQTSHHGVYMRCILGCKWHKLVFAMHTVHGHGQCRRGGWWFRVKEFSLARIRDVPKLSRYNKKSGWLQKEREAKGGMEGKLSKLHFQASLKRASAYGLGNRSGFGKVTIYWATCNK